MLPRDQILATVAKVREWARHLRSGDLVGFSAVAAAEGVSVARVSQLMVLNQLTAEQIDAFFQRPTRPSVRSLILEARRICLFN